MINVSTCENGLPAFTLAEKIVLSTWYGLAGMAAMTGNAVVLCLIYRIPSLRTTSNFFISSLAVADLLVGLVIAPVWIVLRCWYTDVQNYGEAIDFLWIHTTVATTFNLLCVSLDRNVAIFYPLRYQNFLSKRRCFSAIAIVWLMSLCLPCSRFLVDDSSGNLALWMSVSVITILVPMIIILLCSARILKATNRQLNRIIHMNSLPHNQAKVKRAKTNVHQGFQDSIHNSRAVCSLLVTKSSHIVCKLFYSVRLLRSPFLLQHSVVMGRSGCIHFLGN